MEEQIVASAICGICHGSGSLSGRECQQCSGTGKVLVLVRGGGGR